MKEGSNKTFKVLIVEDDKSILDLYERKFSSSGYKVIKAIDGAEGVECFKSEKPDVVILDVMLPIMNGFEVLKKIKSFNEGKDVPIVILSNYGEMPNITEGLMGGAVEYLIKVEHTPEEVVEIVEDALSSRKSLIGEAFKDTV